MTTGVKTILIIMGLIIACVLGYLIRDLVGEKCQKNCYEYCDKKVSNITKKLDNYIFEEIESIEEK